MSPPGDSSRRVEDTRPLEELSQEELDEIDRRLEAVLGPPPDAHRKVQAQSGALDEIFRTRSHLRILRTVFREGAGENLSASEVGRRAGVSQPRTLEVLRLLEKAGIVVVYREPTYAIYEGNSEHPLAAAVMGAFEAEARLTRGAGGRYDDAVTAKVIDGKAMAAEIRGEVAERVRALAERGTTPGLAAVLVGDDEPSKIYVGAKEKACAEVGIKSTRYELAQDTSEDYLLRLISDLNEDASVHGILVQLPLPDQISVLALHETISVDKDVDALTPAAVGRLVRGEATFLPATPFGIVEMLARTGIETKGAEVVIVGRGALVGMPLSIMLAQKTDRGNATVTMCHTATRDLPSHTRRADILVAAAGRPGTITRDMVKPGATVIDVAVNRTDAGLVGDVAFDEVAEVAGWITPVPGGVGPLTVAMLLVNTVTAAERSTG